MTADSGVPFESNPPPDEQPDLDLDVDQLPLTTDPDEDPEKEGRHDERSDDQ